MTDIQKQMLATFLSLRVAVGVVGIVFPFLLWSGGKSAGFHQANSMSGYYHANPDCIDPQHPDAKAPCSVQPPPTGTGPMRNRFVGTLFVVGVSSYVINGFRKWKNIAFGCHLFHLHRVRLYVLFWQDIEIYARYS